MFFMVCNLKDDYTRACYSEKDIRRTLQDKEDFIDQHFNYQLFKRKFKKLMTSPADGDSIFIGDCEILIYFN